MNPRGKQMKVKQPNVAELEGKPPETENGRIPTRVVVVGKSPSVKKISVGEIHTGHHRKGVVSDDHTSDAAPKLV